MQQTCRALIASAIIMLTAPGRISAAPNDFLHQVRPILQKHCYACHGPDKQKSSYRLDIKSEAFKGGDNYGTSIIPEDATKSPLIQFIADPKADLQMPPNERLSPEEIRILTDWVNSGANWPDGVDEAKLEDRRDHWSFKPLMNVGPRSDSPPSWSRGRIDDFIHDKLTRSGFQPSAAAKPTDWLRRVTFDLTGLPPSPQDSSNFRQDLESSNDAAACYQRVVNRLLDSPRYGERWAQHWLDLVRYADTHGFEVNTERPNAWPYRDYVIESFNADVPYDRFVREQIAGDAFDQDIAPGFLITASVLLPAQIGADDVSKRLARQDALDEIVTNIGQTFLGLSIGCARCHDHKFDPISQREYYAMQAFVSGVEYKDREVRRYKNGVLLPPLAELKHHLESVERQLTEVVTPADSGRQRAPINARINSDRFSPVQAKRLRFNILATNNLEPCLDELEVFDLEGKNVALPSAGTQVISSGSTTAPDRHELRFLNDGVYGNSRSWMSNQVGQGWVELQFSEEQTVSRVVWGRDRDGKYADRLATDYRIEAISENEETTVVASSVDRAAYQADTSKQPRYTSVDLDSLMRERGERLLSNRSDLIARLAAAEVDQRSFSGVFRQPDVIHLLTRGDPEQPREEVVPAAPAAISSLVLSADVPEQARRLALARWLSSSDNPLTARVMINRIWQGHFGVGLVDTPNDFGRTGSKPSHPELLDWLAAEFIRSGWSVKEMHRLIVLSATYQQASKIDSDAITRDAETRLLWRYPSRRHDAETIRDSMLACSGKLDLKMYGRGFDLFNQRGGLSGFFPVETFAGDHLRRMVYAHKVRRERDAVFGVFDLPDGGQSTSLRRESMTPMQALNLFNSPFTLAASKAFAERVQKEAGDDVGLQIRLTWLIAFNRDPDETEISDACRLIEQQGLTTVCRVLFNSNEFLFVP